MKTTLLFLSVFLSVSLFGQNVYIPDANFKAYLVGDSDINTNGDTEIQLSEASVFYGAINCYTLQIENLQGIEAFTALTELYCYHNNLTSIDVSQNTALEILQCNNNQLSSLDVSQNPLLETLTCSDNQLTNLDVIQNTALELLQFQYNQLTSLDVSQNTALTCLNFHYNQITSLDVIQNTALVLLDCTGNQLTSLDVSQNTDLWYLDCGWNHLTCLNVANGNNTDILQFTAMGNPNLTCVEVDDAEWSIENWTSIDSQSSFSEACNNDCPPSTVGINDLSTSKNLIQILDLMGRETPFKPNTPLIYVYDDGSIEKVFSVEY